MKLATTMKMPSVDNEFLARSFHVQSDVIAALRSSERSFDAACRDFLLLHRDLAASPKSSNERDQRYVAELHESIGALRAEIEQRLRQATRPAR